MRRRILELTDDSHANVSSMARQLKSKYRDFVDYADVQQELYIWYLTHGHKIEEWAEQHHPKTVQAYIMKSLRNHGEKYCRSEKAARTGYSPDDEFFYTIQMCAEMLQLYFDPEWMLPAYQLGEHTSNKKPPSEGGNLMAMVADVGRAYESMSQGDRDLLRRIYDGERPVREAMEFEAMCNGITYAAQDMRIRRILGRLRKQLGGPAPFEEEQ